MKYFGYFFKDWGQNNTAKTFTKETETEKGMDFKRTVRFQPSETHYFSPPATNTILRTQHSKTTDIRHDILSRSHSKGRIVP
jgi:hypothetical protein